MSDPVSHPTAVEVIGAERADIAAFVAVSRRHRDAAAGRMMRNAFFRFMARLSTLFGAAGKPPAVTFHHRSQRPT